MEFMELLMEEVCPDEPWKILKPEKYMWWIEPHIAWVKWLSYVPEFKRKRISEIESKPVDEISKDEEDELKIFRNESEMLKLFQKYVSGDISKDEYMQVYNIMRTRSLDDLMMSRLSKEELSDAKSQIRSFSELSNEELHQKVEEEKREENYEKLSMLDSYILYELSKVSWNRGLEELSKQISIQISDTDAQSKKDASLNSFPYYMKTLN